MLLATLLLHGAVLGVMLLAKGATFTAVARPYRRCLSLDQTAPGTGDRNTVAEQQPQEQERRQRKEALLYLLGSGEAKLSLQGGKKNVADSVLACPETKKPLVAEVAGPILGDSASGVRVLLRPQGNDDKDRMYEGRTDTFYNLLEAVSKTNGENTIADSSSSSPSPSARSTEDNLASRIRARALAAVPPPLRFVSSVLGVSTGDDEFVPMRDLFTSPTVSYAYERGWRQGFALGGFPGPDREFQMALDYFQPVLLAKGEAQTVVDMSCATGLFTRRFVQCGEFDRVIACDYSEAMLLEARNRIASATPEFRQQKTKLDFVQCDVARIPMNSDSVPAFHAGAAMHCWPDLDQGLSEIYRVLRPGGRYFATTFLTKYFRFLQVLGGGGVALSQRAFQDFTSAQDIKNLLVKAGFQESKVKVEILPPVCVVIQCEK